MLTFPQQSDPTQALYQILLHDTVDIQQVRNFLDKGVALNKRLCGGGNLLHLAAYKGHHAVVALLLERGALIDKPYKHEGVTALHLAAAQGHTVVVAVLLQQRAKINALCKDNWNALHIAVACGWSEIVTQLCENGSDLYAKTSDNQDPLELAIVNKHAAIAMQLKFYRLYADHPMIEPLLGTSVAAVQPLYKAFLAMNLRELPQKANSSVNSSKVNQLKG